MGDQDDAQNHVVEFVDETVQNFRLVADYQRRPYITAHLQRHVQRFNAAFVACAGVTVNNQYAAAWMTAIFTGVYSLIGGMQVIDAAKGGEGITLGIFIMNLDILKEIGSSCWSIYGDFLVLQTTFPALGHIVRYMNFPTDTDKRMHLNRKRLKVGEEMRLKKKASMESKWSAEEEEDAALNNAWGGASASTLATRG